MQWRFDNSYARLPELFYAKLKPEAVASAELLVLNSPLAEELGLEPAALAGKEGAAIFAGNELPEGADPIAQAYAGHQFGHLNMLGDGRAILLGEQLSPGGARFDIQLKGSGRTPFSRNGDGRAALGPMLREYIISEAMHSLGIPSTRSLAVVATGEPVRREEILPGAVLTRVAASHIRVGTFVYAHQVSMQGEKPSHKEALKILADYAIARHYPEAAKEAEPYLAFLHAVIEAQAKLIASWMLVGFIHGVMNTDNMAISGETIDYGPCAFMDHHSPATVFSSIDRNGRYAYGNQPKIGMWNLARLAETLVPLLHADEKLALEKAKEAVGTFGFRYEDFWLRGMRAKLGLFNEEAEDEHLFAALLGWMEKNEADYTNTFRVLSEGCRPADALFQDQLFLDWHARWETRRGRQPQAKDESNSLMRSANPAVIPRNHKVEEALAAATERNDLSVMKKLLAALESPYQDSPAQIGYREPAPGKGEGYKTFCGT